jgi:hypothetical protein
VLAVRSLTINVLDVEVLSLRLTLGMYRGRLFRAKH